MSKIRTIARIDVKNEYAIKGIHLEGLRKVGNPNTLAKKYYEGGIDEIVFMDAVAAYYDRNSLSHIIEGACKNVFVPITVGGGIRTIEDIQEALNAGADKVAINTAAVRDPGFIERAAKIFGSQCIVASIEAKKIAEDRWEAYVDNGREPTGLDAVDWARSLCAFGAGEIMVTSIDAEGTKKGFDLKLNKEISAVVSIPMIVCGGAGNKEHIKALVENCQVDAIATASVLHYDLLDVSQIKAQVVSSGFEVRI